MKKIIALVFLGSASLFADQYNCPNCQGGGSGYYEYTSYNQQYRQNNQDYYQNDRNYQNSDRDWDRQNNYQQNSRQNNQDYYSQNDRNYQDRQNNMNNANNSSDQEIHKQIRDALSSGWFSKGYENVSYDVNNGVVNLRGTVETAKNKTDVEDRIKKIDGVKQVNNNITVSNTNASDKSNNNYSEDKLRESEKKFPQDAAATMEDRQLNARIRDKLNNGWFSKGYQTLILRTSNGVVVISGTVDKPEDAQKISDQVKEVEGTRSVNNQLSTKNP